MLAFDNNHLNIVEIFDKWPVTMCIIILQELKVYNKVGDFDNIKNLFEFIDF